MMDDELEAFDQPTDGRAKASKEHMPGRGPNRPKLARVLAVRVAGVLRPYGWRLVIAGVLLIVSNGLGLAFPLVIRTLLNTVLVERNAALLNGLVGWLALIFLVQALVGTAEGFLVTSIGERISFDLRTRLFRELQKMPLSFFDQRRTGELMSRVTNDVTLLQTSLTSNVLPLASEVVVLVGSIIITLIINWRFTLLAMVVAPVAGLAATLLGRRIRRTTRGVQEGLGDAGIVLEEALSAPRVVKAFNRETYEAGRFDERMRGALTQALRRAAAQAVLSPLSGLIAFSGVTLVIWFGGQEVVAGRLTAGDLIAFVFYMVLVTGPLIALSGIYSQIQAALAAAERIFELMDQPAEISAASSALPELPLASGQVSFERVSFTYPAAASADGTVVARPVVLKDVSFTIGSGQVVALVGPSGAGKTTVLSLLLRFYELDGGIITLDGHDIRDVRVQSLRRQMALVPQEPVLFGDSIAENIRYGRLDASEEDVLQAAAAANALGFIQELPEGMRTLVGERGVKLSAGQRQRIAIARALLHDPRILLLDEATASLDNESEALVQDALHRLMRGRTTLVVAHRLTTVERADQILVLDHGEIVERGSHTELLEQGGLYAKLYRRDFDDFPPLELQVR
jgi:subfamily B ATP-binding cassette protein MsbA